MRLLKKIYDKPAQLLDRLLKNQDQQTLMILSMIWIGGVMVALGVSGNILGTLMAGGALVMLAKVLHMGTPSNMIKKEIKKRTNPKDMLKRSKKMDKWK